MFSKLQISIFRIFCHLSSALFLVFFISNAKSQIGQSSDENCEDGASELIKRWSCDEDGDSRTEFCQCHNGVIESVGTTEGDNTRLEKRKLEFQREKKRKLGELTKTYLANSLVNFSQVDYQVNLDNFLSRGNNLLNECNLDRLNVLVGSNCLSEEQFKEIFDQGSLEFKNEFKKLWAESVGLGNSYSESKCLSIGETRAYEQKKSEEILEGVVFDLFKMKDELISTSMSPEDALSLYAGNKRSSHYRNAKNLKKFVKKFPMLKQIISSKELLTAFFSNLGNIEENSERVRIDIFYNAIRKLSEGELASRFAVSLAEKCDSIFTNVQKFVCENLISKIPDQEPENFDFIQQNVLKDLAGYDEKINLKKFDYFTLYCKRSRKTLSSNLDRNFETMYSEIDPSFSNSYDNIKDILSAQASYAINKDAGGELCDVLTEICSGYNAGERAKCEAKKFQLIYDRYNCNESSEGVCAGGVVATLREMELMKAERRAQAVERALAQSQVDSGGGRGPVYTGNDDQPYVSEFSARMFGNNPPEEVKIIVVERPGAPKVDNTGARERVVVTPERSGEGAAPTRRAAPESRESEDEREEGASERGQTRRTRRVVTPTARTERSGGDAPGRTAARTPDLGSDFTRNIVGNTNQPQVQVPFVAQSELESAGTIVRQSQETRANNEPSSVSRPQAPVVSSENQTTPFTGVAGRSLGGTRGGRNWKGSNCCCFRGVFYRQRGSRRTGKAI